jgi:uncharacterized protein
MTATMRTIELIGLISDTHGLLRQEALWALEGSDLVIHAGDVGDAKILEELRRVAPVVAVRGNIDTGAWSSDLPETAVAQAGSALIYVLHDINALDVFFLRREGTAGFRAPRRGPVGASRLGPVAAGVEMVVSGHSHKPSYQERDGVLYVNPGSAGPRRFSLPVMVARVDLRRKPWKVRFIELIATGKAR